MMPATSNPYQALPSTLEEAKKLYLEILGEGMTGDAYRKAYDADAYRTIKPYELKYKPSSANKAHIGKSLHRRATDACTLLEAFPELSKIYLPSLPGKRAWLSQTWTEKLDITANPGWMEKGYLINALKNLPTDADSFEFLYQDKLYTAICNASSDGTIDNIDALIQDFIENSDGRNTFFIPAYSSYSESNKIGLTPLMIAALQNKPEVFKQLLKSGQFSADQTDSKGHDALYFASNTDAFQRILNDHNNPTTHAPSETTTEDHNPNPPPSLRQPPLPSSRQSLSSLASNPHRQSLLEDSSTPKQRGIFATIAYAIYYMVKFFNELLSKSTPRSLPKTAESNPAIPETAPHNNLATSANTIVQSEPPTNPTEAKNDNQHKQNEANYTTLESFPILHYAVNNIEKIDEFNNIAFQVFQGFHGLSQDDDEPDTQLPSHIEPATNPLDNYPIISFLATRVPALANTVHNAIASSNIAPNDPHQSIPPIALDPPNPIHSNKMQEGSPTNNQCKKMSNYTASLPDINQPSTSAHSGHGSYDWINPTSDMNTLH